MKEDKEDDGKIRVARSKGLTFRLINLRKEPNKRKKELLYKGITRDLLRRYISEGYSLNGRSISVGELAEYFNISLREVMKGINGSVASFMELTNKEGIADTYRALMGLALEGSLADRGLILRQASGLIAAQGNGYVPFLTTAVNQSLKNLLDSQKPILELLRSLNPQGGLVINNNIANENGTYLSANEAVILLDKKNQPLLANDGAQKQLEGTYMDGEVPEVIATRQRGFRLSDDGALTKPQAQPTEHETRRETE